MIKIFEDFNIAHVGQVQSFLESHGIRTHLRNEFSSGALGELPFVEVVPQLYLLEQDDLSRALELLKSIDLEPAD